MVTTRPHTVSICMQRRRAFTRLAIRLLPHCRPLFSIQEAAAEAITIIIIRKRLARHRPLRYNSRLSSLRRALWS